MSEAVITPEAIIDLRGKHICPMYAVVGMMEKSIDEHVGSTGDDGLRALHSYLKYELGVVADMLEEWGEGAFNSPVGGGAA